MSQFIAPRPQNANLTLRMRKPRNPLVAPSLQRQAGRHGEGNTRQGARRDLQKQLLQFDQADRSP